MYFGFFNICSDKYNIMIMNQPPVFTGGIVAPKTLMTTILKRRKGVRTVFVRSIEYGR